MTTLSSPEPTDDDRIRELLADARHTEPIPADVAARLDAALDELRGEAPPAPVPDLAAARRRRNVRNLLVAAAAVVVVGVGISRLDLGVSSSADDGAASGSAADAPAAESAGGGSSAGRAERATGPTVVLSSERFGRQVRTRVTAAYAAPLPSTADQGELSSRPSASGDATTDGLGLGRDLGKAARADCDPASWGPGHRVKARYDGKSGVLIYRPAQGDTQVVELYLCGHDTPTRSVTLSRR